LLCDISLLSYRPNHCCCPYALSVWFLHCWPDLHPPLHSQCSRGRESLHHYNNHMDST